MKSTLHILLVCLPFLVVGQRSIPEHGGTWVHDEANVLSASTIATLETILKAERDSTSNQIAVLVVKSLDGASLEEYTLQVAEQWGLGQKEKDNGVLLLVAIDDRLMRIETGYGLEGVLTDALASRINRNEMAPYFRLGNYDAGIEAGVLAIIQAIQGEYNNDNVQPTRRSSRRSPLATIIMLIVIIFLASRRGRGGRGGRYWSSGSGWVGPMGGFGGHGGSWGSGGSFGGGGGFGGGGSSSSW